ncbi:unnamed protein product [Soboliphyme baturini]|uniref:EF-hand domain-containing protein n=1 Tax=Soboliphyme baturini TaxID=241478 RepID=A0A183J6H0_9BILA|nr:unnamed protein product [Soboliphyme baturini]
MALNSVLFLLLVFVFHCNESTGEHKFGDPNEVRDEKHIRSHLEGQIDTEKEMDPEKMQFHYFKMYDTNNDNVLDGVELIKAMTHLDNPDPNNPKAAPQINDNELEKAVDSILKANDLDGDNAISYPEFRTGQANSQN